MVAGVVLRMMMNMSEEWAGANWNFMRSGQDVRQTRGELSGGKPRDAVRGGVW